MKYAIETAQSARKNAIAACSELQTALWFSVLSENIQAFFGVRPFFQWLARPENSPPSAGETALNTGSGCWLSVSNPYQ